METSLEISYGTLTNKGERAVNEDSLDISITPERLGFILCDGLGGHGKGDAASCFVVKKIKESLEKSASIEESIMQAQAGLLQKQVQDNAGDSMKTTVVCLTISEKYARFGYVGDSRIYHFEKSKYVLRSLDHSVPQMLVNRGDLRDKDIRHHEDRNRLLRVMGTEWDGPKYQISAQIPVTNHTSFLLCSDGFWELIEEKMMCRLLKRARTPQEWLMNMENIVMENGRGNNMDNYSAIAVFIR